MSQTDTAQETAHADTRSMEPVFRIDGTDVITSVNAAGPWDPTMQHGSAPSALVTWAAERIPTPTPMAITRMTIDLMRPVPVAPLTFETDVLREGRKIQLSMVRLRANGTEVARATVLKTRTDTLPLPDGEFESALDLPGPEDSRPIIGLGSSSFVSGMSIRAARGDFGEPGPGAIWFRADRPIIAGEAISQAMRAVVASDFSNGTGAALDFHEWTYLNADLTVSLSREPVGEWILLDAHSWIGPDGAGLAMSRLGDVRGYFGRAIQSLVVEKRR